MRLFLTILVVIVLIMAGAYFMFDLALGDIGKPAYRQITLVSRDQKSRLYIKAKNWGATGDHQLTVISTSSEKEFEADSIQDIVFKGLEPFLYTSDKDTLFLYVRQKNDIPKGFRSKWVIKQIEIDNPKMMNLRRDYDFKKI